MISGNYNINPVRDFGPRSDLFPKFGTASACRRHEEREARAPMCKGFACGAKAEMTHARASMTQEWSHARRFNLTLGSALLIGRHRWLGRP